MLKNFAKLKKGRTFVPGKMAEWSIAPVLKTDELRGSGGSNPSLSAKEAKQGDVEEIRHLFFVLVLRHANLFVGRGSEIKVVDLSTPCFAYFARSPTASEGKDERSDVNPSLSAKEAKQGDVEEIRHLFFVLVLRHANLFVGRGSEIKANKFPFIHHPNPRNFVVCQHSPLYALLSTAATGRIRLWGR